MLRALCLYHKNCLDGNGSAAVVKRLRSDCDFQFCQYGMPVPRVEGRAVYLVDFGFPIEAMRALKAQASELIWIDHHVSQAPVHKELGWGHLDTSECGTSLTWKILFPDIPPPPVVAYIKDKDLWQWKLPNSRAIAAGLSSRFPGSLFDGILEADLDEMACIGEPILASERQTIIAAAQTGIPITNAFGILGLRALAVSCNKLQNDIGEYICLPTDAGGLGYDLAILYYKKSGTGKWVHSLRSADDKRADCAAISARMGGGGHATSACYLNPINFLQSEACPADQRREP